MKFFLVTFFIIINFISYSQNVVNYYDFKHLPQALMANPAFEIERSAYVGIPLLSNIQVDVGSSGVTLHDVFASNTISFGEKLKRAIYQMSANDAFLVNEKVDIFNIGYKISEKNYLSFGLYQELDFYSNFPKSISELFFEGTTQIGKRYDINEYLMQAELLGVYHIGIKRKINRDLNIGGRLKLYSAAFNVKSTKNHGYVYTDLSNEDGLYRHGISTVDTGVQTSGVIDVENETLNTSKFLERMFITGSKGVGIDLGVTYDVNDLLNISASLTDLGFLYHFNDINNYKIKGNFETDGINLLFNPNEPIDYWGNLENEFDESFIIEESEEEYLSWRPMMLTTGFKYYFEELRMGECNYYKGNSTRTTSESWAGALLRLQKRPGTVLFGGSIYYEKNFNNILQARVAYTADKFSFTNLGFSTSLNIGSFNLFMGVNDIIGLAQPSKANSASVQLGMNVLIE